jgi:short subunit dehydrogenase-like uncharacterized protein
MGNILIYGATGYMGKLCAKEMLEGGLRPILAGRSDRVREMAQRLGCRAATFDLKAQEEIQRNLKGVTLVANLAGPFEQTQKPLVLACLATGCHYIDIAGEVNEMRSAFAFSDEAQRMGIMLMPGAGFGVVPTDIAARMAKDLLPDASHLTIFFATKGGVSRGTLLTVLKNIDRPGVRRVKGELISAHPAESRSKFTVASQTFIGVYNPWRADLFTAGISTEIADIGTYSVFPGIVTQMMKGRLLWLRNLLLNRVLSFLPEGPSEQQLQQGKTYVMAAVTNGTVKKSVSFVGPEAYLFTALCLREIATNILRGSYAAGFQTPSYFGKALLDRIGMIEWD